MMKTIGCPNNRLSFLAFVVVLLSLLNVSLGKGNVWDFPPLNVDHPLYNELYDDVKIGDSTVPSSTWVLANETLNAVYAYLHPQSPYRYSTAYRDRLKVLLKGRFDLWAADTDSNGVGDMSGSFQATYAYMLLKHHRPSDLTAAEIASWEAAMVAYCEDQLALRPDLYDDHRTANWWFNGDIRLAMGVYFTGVAINNVTYQNKASAAIDQFLSQAVVGDGAIHKSGYQNESPSYRSWNIEFMLWWWKITGSPEIKAALDKTIPWVPLSVEPSGYAEWSSSIAHKHMYNKGRGRGAALATAYVYGDRYNYFYGQEIEDQFSQEWALMWTMLFPGPMTALTPPSEFILFDRAIMGPRVRTSDWLCVATGRNPQTPEPDHPDQGYDGKMAGKNTFVGAAALGTWANNTPMKAALDGVCVEFKNKTGPTRDWARSKDGGIYRFLSQDEKTSTITRDTFGSLSTSYRLSERVSSDATPDWGTGTDWLGEQVWLLTKERVVGLVQIHNEVADDVYGLDARLVLTGGRFPILGQYLDVNEVAPDEFEFGELKVRVPQTTFTGSRSVQRIATHGSNANDNYTALLRLHDASDLNNDTLISYPADTRRWAVIECVRTDGVFADKAINVKQNNNSVAVLQVWEGNRRFRLVQNLTNSPRTYTGNMWGVSGGTTTMHKSWTTTAEDITPLPGQQVSLTVELPPYGHAVVVSSSNAADHSKNTKYFENVFTQAVTP